MVYIGTDARKGLQMIKQSCETCNTYDQKSRRFKFTTQDDKYFNYTFYADIFYLECRPILHVADEATNFQTLKKLKDMTFESLWRSLPMG